MPDWSAWPFSHDDPYPGYHAARDAGPVTWAPDLGAHLILSHEHARAVLAGTQWSSDLRRNEQLLAALGGPGPGAELFAHSLLTSDPPEHTRLRRAVNRFFTPRAGQGIRDRVRAIVETAIEPLAAGEPLDVMEEIAYAILLAVIAELFDVGTEGAQVMRAETPALVEILDLDPTPATLEAVGTAAMTVMLFLVGIVAERRRDPGDDLISAMVHPPEGEPLETHEIIRMCLLLLAAGHETTANLIGNGLVALLEHPDQLEWLADQPNQAPRAVEELLRYDSPVQVASRIARRDMKVAGTTVRKGDQALVVLGAANRDPARHPDPDRLSLSRTAPSHIGFGHGPHFCVGAGLARLEAAETFERIARSVDLVQARPWEYRRAPSKTLRRLAALSLGH